MRGYWVCVWVRVDVFVGVGVGGWRCGCGCGWVDVWVDKLQLRQLQCIYKYTILINIAAVEAVFVNRTRTALLLHRNERFKVVY